MANTADLERRKAPTRLPPFRGGADLLRLGSSSRERDLKVLISTLYDRENEVIPSLQVAYCLDIK